MLSAYIFLVVSQTHANIDVVFTPFFERRLVENEVVFVEEEIADEHSFCIRMCIIFEDSNVAVLVIN